jgi:hypothetical protein
LFHLRNYNTHGWRRWVKILDFKIYIIFFTKIAQKPSQDCVGYLEKFGYNIKREL